MAVLPLLVVALFGLSACFVVAGFVSKEAALLLRILLYVAVLISAAVVLGLFGYVLSVFFTKYNPWYGDFYSFMVFLVQIALMLMLFAAGTCLCFAVWFV
jgi:hypothetical protein